MIMTSGCFPDMAMGTCSCSALQTKFRRSGNRWFISLAGVFATSDPQLGSSSILAPELADKITFAASFGLRQRDIINLKFNNFRVYYFKMRYVNSFNKESRTNLATNVKS